LPDEADTAATDSDDADVRAALDAAAPKVDDPFMQRLKSRDGWSPTPLPVPSYVDAPEAEHPAPSATAADASSYETEARSREDIAAQFAAELGYRPELSDSAREEGPLEHGRKRPGRRRAADRAPVNAADASSHGTEAGRREDLAGKLAAELGYRSELSGSAREEGPLEHGRKAIRTTKAADLGAVNDVLARRRA